MTGTPTSPINRVLNRSRFAITTVVLSLIGIGFHAVESIDLSDHDRAITRAPGVTLEAVTRIDRFLTHDLYYVHTLLRDVTGSGVVLVHDQGEVNDHYLSASALLTIGRMAFREVGYNPNIVPSIKTPLDFREVHDFYRRRPTDNRGTFHLLVIEGQQDAELVFFITDSGFTLIDRELLEDPNL